MISIRRARPGDSDQIGQTHVAVWRSSYAGILPDTYLAEMSAERHAAQWRRSLACPVAGQAIFVAIAAGPDSPDGEAAPSRVVGFASGGRARSGARDVGEIEMLYLLEDWRDRGVGRRLMRALAAHLNAIGCRSVRLWVLRDNPARWFYQHLGGRPVAEQSIQFAGQPVMQLGLLWEPITVLLAATAPTAER